GKSGWSEVVHREAGAATVPQPAPRADCAALHTTAPVGEPTPFDEHGGLPVPAFGDPPVEARAALGPHTALDMMPDRAVLVVHLVEFALAGSFVPAETTDYIIRP